MDEIKIDFPQKRHPFFVLSGYNIIDTLPPLCLRSGFAPKSGGKVDSKRDETDLYLYLHIRTVSWLPRGDGG